jgi:hypothetical protein
MVLESYGHETSGWSQFWARDPDFATTYQAVSEGTPVENFHLQDGLLCHLGHLSVPSSEHARLIWESHYSRVVGHFGVEKTVAVLQKYFYWLKLREDVKIYIRSCNAYAIAKSTIKKKGLYTPLPTLEKPWVSISMDYMSVLPSTKHGNNCIFVVFDRFSKMAILTACKKNTWLRPQLSSSLSVYGFVLGSHRQSFMIRIAGSSVHFGPSYGHYWKPSSPNPLPSIPKLNARKRWPIGWSCTSYGCTTPNIHAHGMTTFLMCNTTTTKLFIALLDTTCFR